MTPTDPIVAALKAEAERQNFMSRPHMVDLCESLAARLAPPVAPANAAEGKPYTVRDRIWIDGPNLGGSGIYGGPNNEATTWCLHLNNAHAAGHAAGDAAGYERGCPKPRKWPEAPTAFGMYIVQAHGDAQPKLDWYSRNGFSRFEDHEIDWWAPVPAAPAAKEAER